MRTRPMVVAHRGFSGRYPENTLRAFREALKLSVDAVELDVRQTKDGVLILLHDETLDRTTNGRGRVCDFCWDELSRLDAGSWKGAEFAGEPIPRLEEALELIGGQVVVFVEIKEPGTEAAVVETIRRLGATSWVKVGSFHPQVIATVRQLAPELPCSLIGGARVGESDERFRGFVGEALRCGAISVAVNYAALTPERVRYCHQRFLFVGTWTVNTAEQAEGMAATGVDAITSDYPDIVLSVLGE